MREIACWWHNLSRTSVTAISSGTCRSRLKRAERSWLRRLTQRCWRSLKWGPRTNCRIYTRNCSNWSRWSRKATNSHNLWMRALTHRALRHLESNFHQSNQYRRRRRHNLDSPMEASLRIRRSHHHWREAPYRRAGSKRNVLGHQYDILIKIN